MSDITARITCCSDRAPSNSCERISLPSAVDKLMEPSTMLNRSSLMRNFIFKTTILLLFFLFFQNTIAGHSLLQVNAKANSTAYIGYLRMAGIDDEGTLAALLSTIAQANRDGYVRGVQFEARVTSVPCGNYTACADLPAEMEQAYVAPFLASMDELTAVFKPNYLLADRVIDRATELGGVPVIGPLTVRAADFAAGTDHVVHFEQHVRSAIVHLFTYMQQTDGCAYAGILYEDFSEMGQHVAFAQGLFTAGGMAEPPALNLRNATDDDLFGFLSADKRRRCFIVIATHSRVRGLGSRLSQPRFADSAAIPRPLHLYGTSLTAGPSFVDAVGGTAPFAHMHFTRWSPAYVGGLYFHAAVSMRDVLAAWVPTAEERALFVDGMDEFPSGPSDGTLEGYLMAMFALDSVRVAAAADYAEVRANATVPVPWRAVVDSFYDYPHTIGNYPFDRMRRFCPPAPLAQVCYCNTATLTSYVYRVNASHPTGKPYVVFDDAAKGQRNVASLQLEGGCSLNVSSRSYPLTTLLFTVPLTYAPPPGTATLASRLEKQAMVAASITNRVIQANLAPVAPARPYRLATVDVDNNHTTHTAMVESGVQYEPFLVIGSAETIVSKASVLTLVPALLVQMMEDPVLSDLTTWQANIINLIPVLADYIHALASYYSDRASLYTSFHALATTYEEAVLISKSMATFGYDVPVSTIVVGTSAGQWLEALDSWFTGDAQPYVLASVTVSGDVIETLFTAANTYVGRGTIGLATSIVLLNMHYHEVTLVDGADVIFSVSFSDWWLPSKLAALSESDRPLALDPLYWFSQAAADVTVQLSQRAQFDYDLKAADLAYEISVFSSGGNSYGPISNKTCTAAQIAANERDRDCQCTKGPRTMYVLSAQSWQRRVPSTARTGGYSYYIATCGVVYRPYVPPPADRSLAAGSIAGIAVGCGVFVLSLGVVLVVLSVCCLGRNNRNAPSDPSRPFAIVFTDIQSSTALWSRTPSAMSEAVEQHHRIMRRVLGRTRGYEVKTIGDSFMVAFRSAEDAVRFGVEVQTALFEADWNAEIDAVYEELIMEAEAAAGGLDASTGVSAGNEQHQQQQQQGGSPRKEAAGEESYPYSPGLVAVDAFTPAHRRFSEMEASVNFNNNTVSKSVQPVTPLAKGQALSAAAAAPVLTVTSGSQAQASTSVLLSHEVWHGIRVRIGVNYGLGEPRKDPVTHGYDYYGTVVNTAARVEGVGHGGQTLLTADVLGELGPDALRAMGAVAVSLGPQPLRGLDAPIVLTQVVPQVLSARRFPPLRLHIEVDVTEDTTATDPSTADQQSEATVAPQDLAVQLCAQKQYSGLVTAEELLRNLTVLQTVLAPAKAKWQQEAVGKLGECWGFEKAAKAARHEGTRTRLLVTLMGKVSKAINMRGGPSTAAANGRLGDPRGGTLSQVSQSGTNKSTAVSHVQVARGTSSVCALREEPSAASGQMFVSSPTVIKRKMSNTRSTSAGDGGGYVVNFTSASNVPNRFTYSPNSSNAFVSNAIYHPSSGLGGAGMVSTYDNNSTSMGWNRSASSPLYAGGHVPNTSFGATVRNQPPRTSPFLVSGGQDQENGPTTMQTNESNNRFLVTASRLTEEAAMGHSEENASPMVDVSLPIGAVNPAEELLERPL